MWGLAENTDLLWKSGSPAQRGLSDRQEPPKTVGGGVTGRGQPGNRPRGQGLWDGMQRGLWESWSLALEPNFTQLPAVPMT